MIRPNDLESWLGYHVRCYSGYIWLSIQSLPSHRIIYGPEITGTRNTTESPQEFRLRRDKEEISHLGDLCAWFKATKQEQGICYPAQPPFAKCLKDQISEIRTVQGVGPS